MTTFTKIERMDDPNRIGDVIFVHGLNGDARDSWTNAAGEFWPEWIAQDCPNVGVASVGYEVSASAWAGSALPLFDRAPNILAMLDAEGIGDKPICFVTHSMGGLLVKKMLQVADSMSTEYKGISEQTCGVVFLATPHTGSDLATLARFLSFFRSTPAVKEMESRAPALRELNLWYRENVARIGIQTQVYFEMRHTNGVRVVNEGSADPGLQGILPIAVDADHSTISRPENREEWLYKRIRKFVRSLFATSTAPGSHVSANDLERSGTAKVARARALTIEDFVIARNAYHSDLYFERREETAARTALAEGDGLLIVGKPKSGKTRLAWRLLQAYPEALVVIPIADQPPTDFDRAVYAVEEVILLFDDLHQVAETSHPLIWRTVFTAAGAKSCKVICTTRDSDDLKNVEEKQPRLLGKLARIAISGWGRDFSEEDGWLLAQALNLDSDQFRRRFDGTPGSLVLDLSDMNERYRRLRRERQSDIPMSRLVDAAKLLHDARQPNLTDELLRDAAEKIRGNKPVSDELWEELRYRTEDAGFGYFADDEFRPYRPYLENCVEYHPRDRDLAKLIPLLSDRRDYKGLLYLGNALAFEKNGSPFAESAYRASIEGGNREARGNLGAWLIYQPGRDKDAEQTLREARAKPEMPSLPTIWAISTIGSGASPRRKSYITKPLDGDTYLLMTI